MKTYHSVRLFLNLTLLLAVVLLLVACGGQEATLSEAPVYPGATELKAGESTVGDTLAKNVEQNAALKQAMGGMGNTIDQKGFQLPAEATWDQVKNHYNQELANDGWKSGLGGIAASFVDINAIMETANEGNELFKMAIWSKDKQTLTVVMVTDPADAMQKQLLLSLSSQ
jgi:hypothetical protein